MVNESVIIRKSIVFTLSAEDSAPANPYTYLRLVLTVLIRPAHPSVRSDGYPPTVRGRRAFGHGNHSNVLSSDGSYRRDSRLTGHYRSARTCAGSVVPEDQDVPLRRHVWELSRATMHRGTPPSIQRVKYLTGHPKLYQKD